MPLPAESNIASASTSSSMEAPRFVMALWDVPPKDIVTVEPDADTVSPDPGVTPPVLEFWARTCSLALWTVPFSGSLNVMARVPLPV